MSKMESKLPPLPQVSPERKRELDREEMERRLDAMDKGLIGIGIDSLARFVRRLRGKDEEEAGWPH